LKEFAQSVKVKTLASVEIEARFPRVLQNLSSGENRSTKALTLQFPLPEGEGIANPCQLYSLSLWERVGVRAAI
jgi:hypothetical protein